MGTSLFFSSSLTAKAMVPSTSTLQLDMASPSASSSLVTDTDESPFAPTTKFPVKLHQLLEAAENDPWLSSIISWVRDGRGFLIHNQAIFDRQVMPEVFPTMRAFSSFRRQLNLYGIKKSALGGKQQQATGRGTSGTSTSPRLTRCEKYKLTKGSVSAM